MPELPEVETMRRGVLPVAGLRIEQVEFPRCRLKPIAIEPSRERLRRRSRGCRIETVDRVGKRVVLRLDSGDAIVIEPRMTGLVLLADPPGPEHLRVGWRLESQKVPWLWFWDRRGLGVVHLLSPEQAAERLGPPRLGPDALQISVAQLQQRLGPSRREVKVALLDQKAVAGIGNLYASEILHVAGVHPQKACTRVSPAEWQRIHAAMQHVLHEAIRHEGSTLADGTYRNALNQAGGYQNHHRVYARHEQLCGGCGDTTIVRIVQAQRATFFCPQCQPHRRRRAVSKAKHASHLALPEGA